MLAPIPPLPGVISSRILVRPSLPSLLLLAVSFVHLLWLYRKWKNLHIVGHCVCVYQPRSPNSSRDCQAQKAIVLERVALYFALIMNATGLVLSIHRFLTTPHPRSNLNLNCPDAGQLSENCRLRFQCLFWYASHSVCQLHEPKPCVIEPHMCKALSWIAHITFSWWLHLWFDSPSIPKATSNAQKVVLL